MCSKCDYTIHGRHHHFGWDNSFVPAERVAPGSTIEFQCLDAGGGQLTADSTVGDVAKLDFAQGQPGHRADLRRRRRAGRRAQGDDRGVQAVRLRLDGEHPGLRAARRPVQGAGAQHLEVRRRLDGAGALRQERARAAETVRRHDRQRARRKRPPLGGAAAAGRRQSRHPRSRRRHGALSAGRGGGRAVLGRRHACRARRRRGLRHGDREPDGRRAQARPGQGRAG